MPDKCSPHLFPILGYPFVDIPHYLFGGLRVGDPGAGVKDVVNAIVPGRFHEFADIARELDLAFDSALAEEILQRPADRETRAVSLESSEAKFDDLRRMRF